MAPETQPSATRSVTSQWLPAAARRAGDLVLASAVLLTLWKLGALAVGKAIILPSPEQVAAKFSELLGDARFYRAVGATTLRGLSAFGLAMILGSLSGFLAGLSRRFEGLLAPALLVIRATPVLAIILLALIWFPAGFVPVFSAVIMAFPIVSAEVSAAVRSVDPKLVEMARLFRASPARINLEVRLPSALPHFLAASRNALGLAWKVVVAGEVMSQPPEAIGSGMQAARVMLETTEVFAWAAAGILLCAFSDGLFDLILQAYTRQRRPD